MSPRRAAGIFALVFAAACSGGADDATDAASIDALDIDARVIDGPPVCTGMVCDGDCVDTTTSEQQCGSCTNACAAGQACGNSACACVEEAAFIVADPSYFSTMLVAGQIPMTQLGIGPYIADTLNVLLVAMPDAAELDVAYPLSGTNPGTPPFVAVGYDVDINTQAITASFYATAGTVTFTNRCAGGFAGVVSNATFTPASGLMPPVLVDNACVIRGVTTIAFAFGTVCPAP